MSGMRTDSRLLISGKSPTLAVINAVADSEGMAPATLPPLNEFIDPEALEKLLRYESVVVSFEYLDYWVTVHHRSGVTLETATDS